MSATKRIKSLYKKLYNESPWLGVNIRSTLESITAEQASKRVIQNCNTVWELVNHMVSWRRNVLKRISGETIKTPDHNYIEPVLDKSANSWADTLLQLDASQFEWLRFLEEFNERNFENIYPANNMTYYEHIHGIIQHDAYHLGQIVLLIKQLKQE